MRTGASTVTLLCLVSILVLAAALSPAGCTTAAPPETSQLYFSDLRMLVERQDCDGIEEAKAAWEQSWTDSWELESAEEQWIDHGRTGLVLVWKRAEGEDVRVRRDIFSLDGQFVWAHETVLRDGAKMARGTVYISPDGHLKYRYMILLTGEGPKQNPDQPWRSYRSDIICKQLEVVEGGEVVSVYQSQGNFGVRYFLNRRRGHLNVPADTVLVSGVEAPEVRRRKR